MGESSRITFTEGEFYQKHFDTIQYLNSFYSSPNGHSDENFLPFVLRQLSKTFSSGSLQGKRFIDIGSGPTIHSLISACGYFEEIVVSDFTDSNRREMERWLREEEGCFDWSPIIQFVCDLEGNSRSPEEVERRLRQTVKQVLKCDVLLANPFHPLVVEPADCLVSSLCLEAACRDLEVYRRALQSLATLLNPGGALVLIGTLNSSFYAVGERRFSSVTLSQGFIEEALGGLGFSIREFNILPAKNRDSNRLSDFEAIFHLVAQKSN